MDIRLFMPPDWRTELWHVSIQEGQVLRACICLGGWFEPTWHERLHPVDGAAPNIAAFASPDGWTTVEGCVVAVDISGVIMLDIGLPAYALVKDSPGSSGFEAPSWMVSGAGFRGAVRFLLDVFEQNPEEDDAVAGSLPPPVELTIVRIQETDDAGRPLRRVSETPMMAVGGYPHLLDCHLIDNAA